jgi:cytochrome P450
VSQAARERVAACGGRIDVVGELVDPVVDHAIAVYFGSPGPDTATQLRWARSPFEDIFINVSNLEAIHERALSDAPEMRPHVDALAGAQAAARARERALVSAYVFEAMRFRPQNWAVLRKCAADRTIAAGTDGEATIHAGATVACGTLSAMHDETAVDAPEEFRLGPALERLHALRPPPPHLLRRSDQPGPAAGADGRAAGGGRGPARGERRRPAAVGRGLPGRAHRGAGRLSRAARRAAPSGSR